MKRRGFTLLELMIVISIIALLAAILFPMFAKSRETARRSSCANNLSQIGVSLNMYAQNFNGHFPEEDNEFAPIDSYVRNEDIFWCPSDSDKQPWKYVQEPKPVPAPGTNPELGPAPTATPAPGAPPSDSMPGKPGDKDWQKTPPAPVKGGPAMPGAPGAPAPSPAPAPAAPPMPSSFDDEDDSKVPLRTFTSYAYKGGLMNDDRADTPIASEAKTWHRDLVNVLYLGGHVKGQQVKGYKPVVPPRKNPPPPPEQRSGGGG